MDMKALFGLRPKAEDSATLRDKLAEIEAALEVARGRVAELAARRGAVLLDAAEEEAERFERELAAARASAERLEAIAAALPERIVAAEAREAEAGLDALAAEAEREAEAGAALVPQIEQAAEALARLVERHDAHAGRVLESNRRLHAGGRPKVVLPVRRMWPRAEVSLLGSLLSLPSPRGGCQTLTQLQAEVARAKAPPKETGITT